MKELNWWIYQGRKVSEPWAIHLMARKERRRIRADTEIYADWLNNPSKRFVIGDMNIVQTASWIGELGKILAVYGHPLNERDREQLEQELRNLKQQFID